MTGLCIILIDAVVARQETQKKGHLVVYKPMCAAEYKRHRRIFRSSKEYKRRVCYFFNMWI